MGGSWWEKEDSKIGPDEYNTLCKYRPSHDYANTNTHTHTHTLRNVLSECFYDVVWFQAIIAFGGHLALMSNTNIGVQMIRSVIQLIHRKHLTCNYYTHQ